MPPHVLTLYTIGIDELAEITDKLEGRDIVKLWVCGSRALHYKLGVGGGVRQFSVQSTLHFTMPWPVIVSHFARLHTLRLVAASLNIVSHVTDANFLSLSPCIRHIEVTFDCDAELLTDALTASPDRFAQLETVNVSGLHHGDMARQTIHVELVRALPKSVSAVRIKRSGGKRHNIYPLHIEDLSPNLTSIVALETRIELKEERSADEEECHVMSGLTHYQTNTIGGLWMSCLPSHIQSLTVGVIEDEYVHLLPRTLAHLSANFETASVFLAALPRTLTHLDTPHSQHRGIDDEEIGLLPPGLIKMTGNCLKNSLDAHTVALLPRSLRALGSSMVHQDAIPNLPPHITSLSLCGSNFLIHDIPRTCTVLSLYELNNTTVGRMPPNLTRLTVRSAVNSCDAVATLPQSLTQLDGMGVIHLPQAYFSLLPRGLRTLINHRHHIVYNADTSAVLEAPPSCDLPRTLIDCIIGTRYNVTPTWFAQLPPTLTHLGLKLYGLTMESGEALSHLTHLSSLQLSLDEWLVDTLSFMPRALVSLDITCGSSNESIKTHAEKRALIEALPRRLVRCRIPNMSLTDLDMRSRLPRTLTSLSIAGYRPPWFVALPQYPREMDLQELV